MNKPFFKDIYYYLLSVIIPGLINFLSVPILKNLLGSAGYGYYSLWMNAFLITTSSSIGWLTTSFIRFRSSVGSHTVTLSLVKRTATVLCIILAVASFLLLSFMRQEPVFRLVFSCALAVSVFQNCLLAFAQGSFMAKRTVISESIRVIIFFTLAILLLYSSTVSYDIKLFLAVLVSYAVSAFFLYRSIRKNLSKNPETVVNKQEVGFRDIFLYGWPLLFWTFAYSLIPYLDKLTVAEKYGLEAQGDYQAVFDMIYKSLITLLNPVLVAALPHFSKMHSLNDGWAVQKTIKKIIGFEIILAIVLVLAYSLVGKDILASILKIKDDGNILWVGNFTIIAAFGWHLGMVLHKPFELAKRTGIMLTNILISLAVTGFLIWMLGKYSAMITLFPLAIFAGAVAYILLCIFQVKRLPAPAATTEIKRD